MKYLKYDPTRIEELKKMIQAEAKDDKFEEITLESVIIGKKIIEQLPTIINDISGGQVKEVILVTDQTPINRNGVLLKKLVHQTFNNSVITPEILTLEPDDTGLLHADMEGVTKVKSKLNSGKGIVAIGGGTVTDICKYASFIWREENPKNGSTPLIVCQTATTGSAFGSNQASIFKDGVKRTRRALYPIVIAVDLDVITSAPSHLNISGFGDMAGMFISSVDWLAGNMMDMTTGYSELAADIMQDSNNALLNIDRDVGTMSSEGLEELTKILIIAGIVSSLGFGTTPISGFEHMISHALDFEGLTTGRKLSLHGAQVGLASAYASVAYNEFIKDFSPKKINIESCYPSEKEAFDDVVSRFEDLNPNGKSTDEIWKHYKEKLNLWKKKRPVFEKFLENWNKDGGPKEQIRSKLIPAEKVIKALYLSGNPALPEKLTPPLSTEQMKFAFLNARFMRNRFVLSDIIGFLGMMNNKFWIKVDSKVRRNLSTLSQSS